jgi:hypothetical protein
MVRHTKPVKNAPASPLTPDWPRGLPELCTIPHLMADLVREIELRGRADGDAFRG